MRKPIIAGNWKLNKTPHEALLLADELKRELVDITGVDVVLCPPYVDLTDVSDALVDHDFIGSDCKPHERNTEAYLVHHMHLDRHFAVAGAAEDRAVPGEVARLGGRELHFGCASGVDREVEIEFANAQTVRDISAFHH